ncbi:protein of unknown function [Moritella yayanosii]|uniref:Uncharacterized protein n=1 Tax=Moritella yayanosii TaxID=69539 RepID=A0A330LV81_9GAMM|nr:protein of unknown function [Moritella yayanosii]
MLRHWVIGRRCAINGKAESTSFISTFDILVLLTCGVFGSIGIFIAFYIG